MLGRKKDDESASPAEVVTRAAQAAGRTVAGDRGGRAANKVTKALGLGHVETCNDPKCTRCN